MGNAVLFLGERRLPKFHEMSPILKCKYGLSPLQVKVKIFSRDCVQDYNQAEAGALRVEM